MEIQKLEKRIIVLEKLVGYFVKKEMRNDRQERFNDMIYEECLKDGTFLNK